MCGYLCVDKDPNKVGLCMTGCKLVGGWFYSVDVFVIRDKKVKRGQEWKKIAFMRCWDAEEMGKIAEICVVFCNRSGFTSRNEVGSSDSGFIS